MRRWLRRARGRALRPWRTYQTGRAFERMFHRLWLGEPLLPDRRFPQDVAYVAYLLDGDEQRPSRIAAPQPGAEE